MPPELVWVARAWGVLESGFCPLNRLVALRVSHSPHRRQGHAFSSEHGIPNGGLRKRPVVGKLEGWCGLELLQSAIRLQPWKMKLVHLDQIQIRTGKEHERRDVGGSQYDVGEHLPSFVVGCL